MNQDTKHESADPLGLSELPLLEPDGDGWAEIRQALESETLARATSPALRWGALAACLMLVVSIVYVLPRNEVPGNPQMADQQPTSTPESAGTQEPVAGTTTATDVADLIAMSQLLEQRLRDMRDNTASMPANSVAYATELQDLVARLDQEISLQPQSIDLWAQRVNLLLDLEYIYQHSFEREYGRMASL